METSEALNLPGNETICTVVAIVKNNCVLMGRRHYSESEVYWALPGGRAESSESVGEALKREVAEETAIHQLSDITFLGEVPGTHTGDRLLVFCATTAENCTLMEPEKFSEWRWVPLADYYKPGEYSAMNRACMELVQSCNHDIDPAH